MEEHAQTDNQETRRDRADGLTNQLVLGQFPQNQELRIELELGMELGIDQALEPTTDRRTYVEVGPVTGKGVFHCKGKVAAATATAAAAGIVPPAAAANPVTITSPPSSSSSFVDCLRGVRSSLARRV